MAVSPTQLTLKRCRDNGWMAQVVEHYDHYARIKRDLFRCIDVLAIGDCGILGIQATSFSNHSARMLKAMESLEVTQWLLSGGRFEVWSWGKKARKPPHRHCNHTARCSCIWMPRVEVLTLTDEPTERPDLNVPFRPDLQDALEERARRERGLFSEDPMMRGHVSCAGPSCGKPAIEPFHFCSRACRDAWMRANA